MLAFCVHCHQPCWNKDLCTSCAQNLPWIDHLHIPPPKYVDEVHSLFFFDPPVQQWIHQYKYGGKLFYAKLFSQLMQTQLVPHFLVETLMAVPIHSSKLQERGYNQSYEISRLLSKSLDIADHSHGLIRTKKTLSQTGLKAKKRRSNVRNAFACLPNAQIEQGVLLIDDVITTGSTVSAIAQTIRKKHPRSFIQVWTIASMLR